MYFQGESPLHTACRCGLANLTAELLQQGANPNLQTQKALPDDTLGVALQTPLHMAIAHNHPDVVSVILEQKGLYLWAQLTTTSRPLDRCEYKHGCWSWTAILFKLKHYCLEVGKSAWLFSFWCLMVHVCALHWNKLKSAPPLVSFCLCIGS